MRDKFNMDEYGAIHFAYCSVWHDYQKLKRKRNISKEKKEFSLNLYKKRLQTLQHIIIDHLNMECKFKEL